MNNNNKKNHFFFKKKSNTESYDVFSYFADSSRICFSRGFRVSYSWFRKEFVMFCIDSMCVTDS